MEDNVAHIIGVRIVDRKEMKNVLQTYLSQKEWTKPLLIFGRGGSGKRGYLNDFIEHQTIAYIPFSDGSSSYFGESQPDGKNPNNFYLPKDILSSKYETSPIVYEKGSINTLISNEEVNDICPLNEVDIKYCEWVQTLTNRPVIILSNGYKIPQNVQNIDCIEYRCTLQDWIEYNIEKGIRTEAFEFIVRFLKQYPALFQKDYPKSWSELVVSIQHRYIEGQKNLQDAVKETIVRWPLDIQNAIGNYLSDSLTGGNISKIEKSEYSCVGDIIEEIKEQHKRNGNVSTTTHSGHFAKMCNERRSVIWHK